MKQYLELLREIKTSGTDKPAAREGMPGTRSLFGYQFRHNLGTGFPLLTTKKMFWKGVVVELLWFLRGDTNIKYLVDNGVNIWNEDAYNYYVKICKQVNEQPCSYEGFIASIEVGDLTGWRNMPKGFRLGDCGYQYGRVWRSWNDDTDGNYGSGLDQLSNVINQLKKNPESRRHIVTAIDPVHDFDLALYWCHAMFQFNCRPMTLDERISYHMGGDFEIIGDKTAVFKHNIMDDLKIPKYYLDCQLYQRSADVFLGVPFNIASYALLTHVIAKMCNMVPGDFVHTFGDVHIYDNHNGQVEEQLKRMPSLLPILDISENVNWSGSLDDVLNDIRIHEWHNVFRLLEYNPQEAIKAELSTGLKKSV